MLGEIKVNGVGNQSWTRRWLEVLKLEGQRGFHPEIPPFGFGDPLSYNLVERTAQKVINTGAVRHGAEYAACMQLFERMLAARHSHGEDG